MFASVVIQIDAPGLKQPYTYAVPDGVVLGIGDTVIAPFAGRTVTGYIVGVADECPPDIRSKIRPITAKIEGASLFDESLYELTQWVTQNTLCDLRDAVRLIAPEIMATQISTQWSLSDDWEERLQGTRSEPQRQVVAALLELGGSGSVSKLSKQCPGQVLGPVLNELRRKGVAREERRIKQPKAHQKVMRVLALSADIDVASSEAIRLDGRAPRQAQLLRALIDAASSTGGLPMSGVAVGSAFYEAARAVAGKGLAQYIETPVHRNPYRVLGVGTSDPPGLTDRQHEAVSRIGAHVAAQDCATVLLHGVTGSGKTEVYLHSVRDALDRGHTALVLVPEIGLTAQLLDLFKGRFGDPDVAVLHSALSAGERYDEWQRIRKGEARVVLGARSSVFAPVRNLGLIIIDEEHDGSYKQDSSPRYHARDVARRRAAQNGAVVVLGSATPALESFFQAKAGHYDLVSLAERIDSRPLPRVQIVDLRKEFGRKKKERNAQPGGAAEAPAAAGDGAAEAPSTPKDGEAPPRTVFGKELTAAIGERLARQEQVILFMNRRGFASFLLCRDCGFTPICPNCDVSLTYHHGVRLLQCHHCDHRETPPDACPKCEGLRLRPFGLGTEKVEEAVQLQFPLARTLRMDRDTMARKGAHAETLRAFRRGDADILIGTQIVAKGLDFPNVTLVGVVSADTALNVPDFRSSERAFQLLTQVAGRAGRGKRPGEVIIQTFNPEHESVLRAAEHDYLSFYADEILQRQEVGYPPFAVMANIVISDEDEQMAQQRCENLALALRSAMSGSADDVSILGPVACPLSRLRSRYRWHVVLRARKRDELLSLLRLTLDNVGPAERQGLSVDIDPLTML